MSSWEATTAVAATTAGLAAIVIDYASADRNGGLLVVGIAAAVTVGVAVLLFAGAMPHATAGARAAETALVTSAVGFLSVASAWTGLPFVLGAGGALMGSAARHDAAQPRQRGLAAFAVALGVGAIALGALAVVAL